VAGGSSEVEGVPSTDNALLLNSSDTRVLNKNERNTREIEEKPSKYRSAPSDCQKKLQSNETKCGRRESNLVTVSLESGSRSRGVPRPHGCSVCNGEVLHEF
jgi:hypothetical protein